MARVAIAIKTLKGSFKEAFLDIQDSAMTGGDPTNDHEWLHQSGDLLIVRNTHATLTRAVEIIPALDSQARSIAPTVQTIPALQCGIWGPLEADGWVDSTDGKVDINLNDGGANDVRLAVLRR